MKPTRIDTAMRTTIELLPGIENRRVGRVTGDDGLEP